MESIDFSRHSHYVLGDTHMSYEQIAKETGYAATTISKHCTKGPLQGATRVRYPSAAGGQKVAVEYDAVLHRYLSEYSAPVPTERLKRLTKHMSPAEIAKEVGMERTAVHKRLSAAGIQARSWRYQVLHERTYARQQHAQSLRQEGQSVSEIAGAMGLSKDTIRTYLRDEYERPPLIEGRTHVWEREREEHGLW